MKKFKRHRDYGFFDQDIRLSKLSKLGDPMEKLKNGIDFEKFRELLEEKLTSKAKGAGGRPPYDYVLLFKILILQRYYNLSDEQAEYQINDRMSFMRFLDLTIADDIPDSRTIWLFNEKISDLGLAKELFDLFEIHLESLGLIANEGKIIDASFVEVPRQRNTREENAHIKEHGTIPADWKDKDAKIAQKDIEARWTKKNNVSYFGYKNHGKVDSVSKLLTQYKVTTASVHDSQTLGELLSEKDKGEELYADSAYVGQQDTLDKHEMINQVHEKGSRNNPLTDQQKASNKVKSSTRVRVEHIFGFMENSMGGMKLRKIGMRRAENIIGLMNLTYNMFRKIQLVQS